MRDDEGIAGLGRRIAERYGDEFKGALSGRLRRGSMVAVMYVFGARRLAIGHAIREIHPRVARLGLRRLSERIVRAIRVALRPITRSGRLANSFGCDLRENWSDIYTTEPYGVSILPDGKLDEGIPSIEDLKAWARRKPELRDLDEKDFERTMYAIQRAIKTKRGLGKTGRSTLVALPPKGKRAYEYREVAFSLVERSEVGGTDMEKAWEEVLSELD